MYRAVATGTAGTAMAVPLFDKVANKFERILSLLLDLSRSMCRIRTYVDIAITKHLKYLFKSTGANWPIFIDDSS